MAIKNIDPLIDAMSPNQTQEALLSTATENVPAPMEAPAIEEPPVDPAEDSVFTGESTEVAVLGPIRKILGEAPKRTREVPSLRKPEAVSEEMATAIRETEPEMPVAGKPPETVFNLNRIQGPEELKQHIEAVARASGAGDIEKISFDEVTAKVIAEGYDQKFVNNIINLNRNLEADPAQVYKMMLALSDAQKRAFELAKKVDTASLDGSLTDDMMLEFRQALALEGLLAKGAKQKQANIARSLAIFGQAREGTEFRGAGMTELVNSMGGKGDFVSLARAYASTPSQTKRVALAERSLGSRVKDIWFTTWINGILSSPVTHAKNMTANSLYVGLNLAEKQSASLIGQARRLMFGSEDIIRQEEVFVDMYSMAQGFREGATLAKEAWKQNKQITGLSKLEYKTLDDPFNVQVADDASDFQKGVAKAFGWWGKFVSAPGRALMAEDEFFKAFNYRRSLNTLAYREQKRYLGELVDSGMDINEAKALADERMAGILSNPPDEIHREALDFAGEMTFTKELEGRLASMERITQHPMAKMYVPFIRTPTNIAIELNKRTPAAFLSKRVREDWAAGGVKRDMVIARATLGSGMMYGIGSMALEGDITGAGPYRKEDKDVLRSQGWQPYSIVLDKFDVDDAQLKQFQNMTNVSVGPDKVYVSYLGLEPVGALMGIGATVGEYSMMEPDADAMEKLFTGAGIGVSDYMSELPVISGVNELMTTFRGRGKEGTDYLLSVFSNMTQQVSEVAIGGSPAGAYSSLIAYTNRILDPDVKSPIPTLEDYSDLNPAFKGFMDALSMYYNRNPVTAPGRPGQLDSITGQRKAHGSSSAWGRAMPFALSEGRYSPAHELLDVLGVGQYQPKKRMDGVELNAQQYNRLIELATQEPMFSNGNTLEMELIDLANDQKFVDFAQDNPLDAKEWVKGVVSDAYKTAKQRLIEEDSSLAIGIERLQIGEEMKVERKVQQMLQ
jgi:hypothetical protein